MIGKKPSMFSLFLSLIIVSFLTTSEEQITAQEAKHILSVAGWPNETHQEALNVMWCESRRMPNSVGDNGNSIGLFQIQWTPKTWVGWQSYPKMEHLRNKDIGSPITNAQAALVIYNNFGWEPWTCKP